MKIKHKIGFIALVTVVDIFVIVLVVLNNSKTNIQNDVKTKTSAHIMNNAIKEDNNITEIVESNNMEETKNEETNTEEIQEIVSNPIETVEENNNVETVSQSINVASLESTEPEGIDIVSEENNKSYDDMTIEEKNAALQTGTLALEYSGLYTNSSERLTKSRGVVYYNEHKETYYSERVLPGTGLNIPGRHVAEDGTVRDGDGYICVASDYSYLPKGSILITSLGPAKVYDTGCSYGTIDIYVNW